MSSQPSASSVPVSASAPDLLSSVSLRTAEGEQVLSRACCLRCSKCLDDEGWNCGKAAFKKCARCARLKKPCDPIPLAFIDAANRLMEYRRDLEELRENPEADPMELSETASALAARQQNYVKAVTAHLVSAGRMGGHSKPKSSVDWARHQVRALDRIGDLLVQLVDMKRAEANLPKLGDHSSQYYDDEEL